MRPVDVASTYYGSVIELMPLTPAGQLWMKQNLATEDWQRDGKCIACEPHMAVDALNAMVEAGLCVGDTKSGLRRFKQ